MLYRIMGLVEYNVLFLKISWLYVYVNILYIDINNNDGILEEYEYYMVWLEICV